MALAVTRDKTKISSKGGDIFKVTERQETGAALTTADTVHDFGSIKSSKFRNKYPMEKITDERGKVAKYEEGEMDSGFEVVLNQRDKNVLDFVSEVKNKFYLAMRQLSETGGVGGKTQFIFGFGQISPEVEFDLPGGSVPVKFEGVTCESTITIGTTELTNWTSAITASVTIAAGDWCAIVEV